MWEVRHEDALRELKSLVGESPVLMSITEHSQLVVRTDASKEGVGAILVIVEDDSEKIAAFISHRFKSAARNWSTVNQEGFAIFYAVTSWRVYLAGRQFTGTCCICGYRRPIGSLENYTSGVQLHS